MNKGLLIGLGAIAVVGVVGAGAYLVLSNRPTSSGPSTAQTQTSTEANTTSGTPKSLRDLMTLANNQMCTFTDVDSQSQGTVYVGGGKVRGDFSGQTGATATNTHMIYDSTDVYVWFDGAESGFKGNLEAITNASGQTADPKTKSIDPDRQVDYDCSPWAVDNTKFALPNMTFTDYSSMMMGLPSAMPQASGAGGTDLQSAQCAACDSLPGDAAVQCKQALNCN